MGKTCKFLSYCGTAVMVCHMSTHSFPLNFVNFAYRCVYMECLLKCVCVRTAVHVPASLCCSPPYILRQGSTRACCGQTPGHTRLWLLSPSPALRAGLQVSTSSPDLSICAGDPHSGPHAVAGILPLSHLLGHICVSSSQCPSAFTVPSQLSQWFCPSCFSFWSWTQSWIMLCI